MHLIEADFQANKCEQVKPPTNLTQQLQVKSQSNGQKNENKREAEDKTLVSDNIISFRFRGAISFKNLKTEAMTNINAPMFSQGSIGEIRIESDKALEMTNRRIMQMNCEDFAKRAIFTYPRPDIRVLDIFGKIG